MVAADRLPKEDFERDYYRGNRPLIIRGAVEHWPAFRRWSQEYLESRLGDRQVPVDYSRSGFLTYTALDGQENTHRTEMSFREAAAEICRPEPDRCCYLRNVSIPHLFPELLEDFDTPALAGDSQRITMNHFWYGAPGCVTALHFDWTSNLLVQVQGRKRVILFDPAQTPFLYPAGDAPVPPGGTIDLREHSLLDPERPDYTRFPLFRKARPQARVLGPGDMLWLPPNWWHQMRALDVSISVNFWWLVHLDQILFMDELIGRMPAAYDAGVLEGYLLRATETRDFNGLIAMAERCRDLSKRWAAVLTAAVALEQTLRHLCLDRQLIGQEDKGGLRLAALNAELARADVVGRLDEAALARYNRLISEAKAMDDARLDEAEVQAMLAEGRAFIDHQSRWDPARG